MDTDEFTAAATNPTVTCATANEGSKESPSTKTDDVAKAPSPIRTRRQLAALSQPTTSAAAAASTKPAHVELPPPSPIIRVEHKRLEDLLNLLVDKTKNSNVHALEKIHVALTQV